MTTDMYDENQILGYVEDTLTPEERTSFEQLMQTDAQLASLVASMCQDRELLSDLDQVTAPMELGDYVSAQLERQMLLGPLPQRRHAIPSNRSTPQSRSHSRFMRIWAYGSLAAMFLIVVGLMYDHIGHQSLIERTENLSFKTESTGDTTVAMKQSLPADSAIDDIIKLPAKPQVAHDAATTSGLRLDEEVQPRAMAEVQVLSPAPTATPVIQSKEQPPAAQPMVALGTTLGDDQDQPIAQRSSMARARSVSEDSLAENSAPKLDKTHTLKELSPTTAALGREVDADRYAGIANQPTVASTPAAPAPAPVASDQLLSWDSNAASDNRKSRFSAVTGIEAKTPANSPPTVDLFKAESTVAGSQFAPKGIAQIGVVASPPQLNLQNQQQSVCVIQSNQPQDTVNQITQWAIRNQVQIIEPAVTEPTKDKLAKATDDKPATEQARAESEKKKMDQQLQRQVITLNMHANQVPVLVQWLNGQHNQLNNWIAPMPQSHTTNESLQRLQQELPLAPTIPLVKPDEVMAVQLMIVPDPRNSQTSQPPAK